MAIRFKNLMGGKGSTSRQPGVSRDGSAADAGPVSAAASRSALVARTALLPLSPKRVSARYTRFVYAMKVMLPALAIALVVLVVAWPQLTREDKSFSLGIADVDIAADEDTNMVNARYVGTDDKKQPYTVTADLARDLDKEGSRVLLSAPKADILMEDGTWLIMSAAKGIYRRNDDALELTGQVTLFHDSGYEFRTENAVINLGKGEARSTVPVRGQGPFGDLTAEGLIVRDQGKTLTFTGRARAVLYPAGKDR